MKEMIMKSYQSRDHYFVTCVSMAFLRIERSLPTTYSLIFGAWIMMIIVRILVRCAFGSSIASGRYCSKSPLQHDRNRYITAKVTTLNAATLHIQYMTIRWKGSMKRYITKSIPFSPITAPDTLEITWNLENRVESWTAMDNVSVITWFPFHMHTTSSTHSTHDTPPHSQLWSAFRWSSLPTSSTEYLPPSPPITLVKWRDIPIFTLIHLSIHILDLKGELVQNTVITTTESISSSNISISIRFSGYDIQIIGRRQTDYWQTFMQTLFTGNRSPKHSIWSVIPPHHLNTHRHKTIRSTILITPSKTTPVNLTAVIVYSFIGDNALGVPWSNPSFCDLRTSGRSGWMSQLPESHCLGRMRIP